MLENVLPTFAIRSFMVTCIIFNPLNHFVYGMREYHNFTDFYIWLPGLLLIFFNWGVWFLSCWVLKSSLYISDTVPYQMCILQKFSTTLWLVFHSLNNVLCRTEISSFNKVKFNILFLSWIMLLVLYLIKFITKPKVI